jgi:hypothetical protein
MLLHFTQIIFEIVVAGVKKHKLTRKNKYLIIVWVNYKTYFWFEVHRQFFVLSTVPSAFVD